MRFEENIWNAAVETAARRSQPQAAGIARRFGDASFPGAIALMAGPGRIGGLPRDADLVNRLAVAIADTREAKRYGLSTDQAGEILRGMFVERTPIATPSREELRDLVVQKALGEQGIPLKFEQAQEIVDILQTGKFFGDLETVGRAVAQEVPRLPLNLIEDASRIDELLGALPAALWHDAGQAPGKLLKLLGGLWRRFAKGDSGAMPRLESSLLASMFATHSVTSIRVLVTELLDRDNRTVRLAIILYASANGWNLTDEDIDAVYRLFEQDNPDLAAPIERAALFMAERYTPGDVDEVLEAIRRVSPRDAPS